MKDSKYLITNKEAIFLILTVVISKLILNVPATLVLETQSGTLINLIFIFLLSYLFLSLILKLLNTFPSSDIFSISLYLGGNILKIITTIIFLFILLLGITATLVDFTHILQIIYFKDFNIIYILLFFLIGALICNKLGFKSIVKTIILILPLAVFTIIFSTFGVRDYFNVSNYTPILGQNLETTFIKGISNIYSQFIIIYYLFLKPFLKDQSKYNKVCKISYILSFIFLVLTVIPILNLYSNTNNSESINYLYLLSRNISLGSFINRVDAIFVLFWIFLTLSYSSLTIFMMNHILGNLLKIENKTELSYLNILIICIICIIPITISDFTSIANNLYKVIIILLGFIYPLLILILANLKKKLKP